MIILALYVNLGPHPKARHIDEVRQKMAEFAPNLPEDIKERYFVTSFVFPTEEDTRLECVFPKKPDANVMAKINELIDEQNKTYTWLQQHSTKGE